MEEVIFELGPAGGKRVRPERKEISHRRMLEAKLGKGESASEQGPQAAGLEQMR